MKKCIIAYLISLLILLSGCSVGTTNNSSTPADQSVSSTDIQIDNIATIPYTNYTVGEYVLAGITTSSDSDITLQNTQINANGRIIPASAISSYIDLKSCLLIAKHKSCQAKIFTNPVFQSYLLTLTFVDSSGKTHTANQVISFNALLPVQNGFIYDATQLAPNNNSLTIPFRLADNYSRLNVLVNNNPAQFSCYGNKYTTNTLCSININANNLPNGSSSTNTVKIIGYDNSSQITNTIMVLTNTQAANLITSGQNVVINPDNGSNPQTVYLVNNGLAAATGITITPATPVTITSNTCGSSLNAGANCSFVINVTGSPVSGQAAVGVTYFNGLNNQNLFFNISYINQSTAGMTITNSGSFNNKVINTGPFYITANISNTGNINLSNLQFSNLNLQKNTMSSLAVGSSCYNGINLNTGQNCTIIFSYIPTSAESGTVNFIPTAGYLASAGESRTYANSVLNIPYSSISSANFVVIGEFGTTIRSTNIPPTTWVANINSPFSNNSVIANGITINNGIYAMMLNNGIVESSTQNGLFWKQAGTTNYSVSNCGIIYNGSAYYTCGTNSLVLANCPNTGRGCVESSSNLITWVSIVQPPAAVTFNNIYYYTNGISQAYLATYPASGTTSGAVTSDGNVLTNPTTGFSGTGLYATAFNTTLNTVTMWATNGFNTTAPIGNVTSSWAVNTTNRPANSQVRAAIFNNGRYTVGNNAGDIYTSITSNGPYTIVYNGASQINSITYGNGSYLAATANGPLESVASGGWTIDSTSSVNYTSAYFDGTRFWLTGTSALRTATTIPPTNSWDSPALISITKNGNNYLAIDTFGNIYTSSNLTSWTQQTNPSGNLLNSIYCAGLNICFAIGDNGTILKSTNGTTWSQLSSGTSAQLQGIFCQFGTCVIVGGTNAINSGTVLTSSDHTNWTISTTSLATRNLYGVSFLNNQFFAVGRSGALFSSTNNGIDWLAKTSGAGANDLNSITCGNIGCVAVGNGGTIIFSSSGGSWAAQTSGTTSNLHNVTYNGVFVAVGNTTAIRQSTNGTTWNTGTFPVTSAANTILFSVISQ